MSLQGSSIPRKISSSESITIQGARQHNLKNLSLKIPKNSQEVSFENTQATDNINKVRGRLHAVAHADKTLASLDLFIDLKGMLLPRLLPDQAIRVATKLILRSAIETAEESK